MALISLTKVRSFLLEWARYRNLSLQFVSTTNQLEGKQARALKRVRLISNVASLTE